jgi:hypothetical protein
METGIDALMELADYLRSEKKRLEERFKACPDHIHDRKLMLLGDSSQTGIILDYVVDMIEKRQGDPTYDSK